MRKLLLSTAFISASFIAIADKEAIACNCINYDYGHVNDTSVEIQDHFTSRIGIMQDALENIIIHATGQLVSTLKEQVQGQAQMEQTKDQREVVRRIQDVKMDATRSAQSSPSACINISGVAASEGSRSSVKIITAALSEMNDDWNLGVTDRFSIEDNPSEEAILDERLRRNASFCDEEMAYLGLCSINGTKDRQGASMNATKSVLKANTYSDSDIEASKAFVINAINPNPQLTLPPHLSQTEQGKRLLADKQAVRARTSVAEHFMTGLQARRMPQQKVVAGGNGRQTRRAWAESVASEVIGYSPDGTNFPFGVSEMDWMELYASKWTMNPEWHASLNSDGLNDTVILKEIAAMIAWQNYMQFQQFKLDEERGAIDAATLAILTDMSKNEADEVRLR